MSPHQLGTAVAVASLFSPKPTEAVDDPEDQVDEDRPEAGDDIRE
jgi:hypothetical protein